MLTLGAMRTARKIRYRLEWLALTSATKFLPLLSRKACYRLALLLGSLGAMLDRRGRRVALSNLRVAFGDEISSERRRPSLSKTGKTRRSPASNDVTESLTTFNVLFKKQGRPVPNQRLGQRSAIVYGKI
jgi:hypothetical protein